MSGSAAPSAPEAKGRMRGHAENFGSAFSSTERRRVPPASCSSACDVSRPPATTGVAPQFTQPNWKFQEFYQNLRSGTELLLRV